MQPREAKAYEKLIINETAKSYYEKIVALEPDNSIALDNLKILKEQRK